MAFYKGGYAALFLQTFFMVCADYFEDEISYYSKQAGTEIV